MEAFCQMFYNRALTNWAGTKFFLLVKWVPLMFAVICLGGIGLGAFCLLGHADPRQIKGAMLLKPLGVLMIVSYAGRLVTWFVKLWNGTWAGFCDRQIEFFESR